MTCASGDATGNLDVVRDYTETRSCRRKSWLHLRRVVARIEATPERSRCSLRRYQYRLWVLAAWLYDGLYCARGQAENLIKRGTRANWRLTRTSCRSPLANQMRLILSTPPPTGS